jgi:hypothetical protein
MEDHQRDHLEEARQEEARQEEAHQEEARQGEVCQEEAHQCLFLPLQSWREEGMTN